MYDKAFFDWFVPHRPLYKPVAVWVDRRIRPWSVLDLGCGNGFFLDIIGGGLSVGVDFVDEACAAMPEYLRENFVKADLEKPLDLKRRFELVICTEVAEHLPPAAAGTIVETIRRHADDWVLFSAATPGQGGEGHLNEQPHAYWVDLLEAGGHFQWMRGETVDVRMAAPEALSWIRNNALIFRRTRA